MFQEHPLRGYRRAHNLTLEALAARAETTAATLSRVEKGLLRPSFGLLRRLVEATDNDVSADEILVAVPKPEAAA